MTKWALAGLRVACVVALLASAALYVHYLDPAGSAFCGLDSGCEAVRRNFLSYVGSRYVSLPLIGLLAFAGLFALSLRPSLRTSAAFSLGVYISGLAGAGLLVVQGAIVGRFCWLCAIVDLAAVTASGFGLLLVRPKQPSPQVELLTRQGWLALAALAVVGPVGYGFVKTEPAIPAEIRALYQAGKVNVVEVVDFQCPHCRRLHPVLKGVLAESEMDVAFRRLHMPLRQHVHAFGAAKAAVCAEQQGQTEPMADALFARQLGDEELYGQLARELGLDVERFTECMDGEAAEQRVRDDMELIQSAGFAGLPTTYVGASRIVGAQSPAVYADALQRARRGGGRVDPALVELGYLVLIGVLLAATLFFGRVRGDSAGNGVPA